MQEVSKEWIRDFAGFHCKKPNGHQGEIGVQLYKWLNIVECCTVTKFRQLLIAVVTLQLKSFHGVTSGKIFTKMKWDQYTVSLQIQVKDCQKKFSSSLAFQVTWTINWMMYCDKTITHHHQKAKCVKINFFKCFYGLISKKMVHIVFTSVSFFLLLLLLLLLCVFVSKMLQALRLLNQPSQLNALFTPQPPKGLVMELTKNGICRSHGLAAILDFTDNMFWAILGSFLMKVNHFRVCCKGTKCLQYILCF